MNQPKLFLAIIFCVLLTTAGQIFLKLGATHSTLAGLLETGSVWTFVSRAFLLPAVIVGLVLYAGSTVLWILILSRADLSFAYPLVSLGFVLTALYGYFALQEQLSLSRIAGIGLIVVGVILISRS